MAARTTRKKIKGYVRDEEVEQIVRSALRTAARTASRVQTAQPVISEERLRELVTEGVTTAFAAVGLDAEDPKETRKDLEYLRTWRQMMQKGGSRAATTVISVGTLGVVAAALVGLGLPAKFLALFGIAASAKP